MNSVLITIASFMMMFGVTPKEYVVKFDKLGFWQFDDCVIVDSFEESAKIMKSFDLTNCEVRITPEGDFDPDSFKEQVKMCKYNLAVMGERPCVPDDFNNQGYLVIPDGSGYLAVYDWWKRKVIEIKYRDNLPYSIKLLKSDSLFYVAEGIFEVSYFEGAPVYALVYGKAELM